MYRHNKYGRKTNTVVLMSSKENTPNSLIPHDDGVEEVKKLEVVKNSIAVAGFGEGPGLDVEKDINLYPQSVENIESEIKNLIERITETTEEVEVKDENEIEKVESLPGKSNLPRIIDLLVKHNAITEEMVERALEIKKIDTHKRRLLDILVEDLAVDRDVIFKHVARLYSFQTVDATSVFGNKERLQFIKKLLTSLQPYYYELSVRHKILPFELYKNGNNKLVLVTPDPTHPNVNKVASAYNFTKYEIKYISLAEWNELWRGIAFDQGFKPAGLDIEGEFSEFTKTEYENELERSLEENVGTGKLVDLVESLLVDGVRTGASDIHVVPRGALRTEFHFRIDGKLSLWSTVSDVRAESILSVVKDRAKNLDRFEKFLSQDGFAQRTIDNQIIRFRFSTMPIYGGDLRSKLESVVIRILRGAEVLGDMHSLGMNDIETNTFTKSINKSQGMVILTGPTGSGKSTTQLAALKIIMDPALNIITIEDPVEYLIEGCRQVKLNHKLDFEGALRGLLRHDPDIVMVGEMRDKPTADIAVKLANTGHLIFSTLHTNDSVSAITRLYNMGIEPFLLAYTINIIVAQRLVRKLCERCKTVDDNVDYDLLTELGYPVNEVKGIKLYKPVGCIRCVKGFRGRSGIFEILQMTKDIRQIILKSSDMINEEAIRSLAIKNGMQTLKKSAFDMVKSGVTSLSEIAGLTLED
jgi:type IV pilus assembly protein PilB